MNDDSDPDWTLTLRLLREQTQKPESITLTLPAKSIPSLLAKCTVVNRISLRLELKVIASLLKAGGANILDTSLSKSTVHRQRVQEVKKMVKDLKDNFKVPEDVTIHWDGKIIQVMSGLTEDRIAVVISSAGGDISGQFLASPAIPSGTGRAQADAVYDVLRLWNLILGRIIKAMVFDTTPSNTGWKSGAAILLERLLGYALFYLACRHHISELHVSHANEDCRGVANGM
jgi:hypothetical protein